MGRVELADQRAGVDKLISMGFADPKRVGIFGWSYGGFMTLYSLLHAPDVFKAGIAGAPVTDFRNYDTIYTERYLGLPGENKVGYDKSSNVLAADKLQGKLLIIHNFEDDNVLFQNSLADDKRPSEGRTSSSTSCCSRRRVTASADRCERRCTKA